MTDAGRPAGGNGRERARAQALSVAAGRSINMFNRDSSLPIGMLPYDAQYRLKAAAKVGEKESLTRQRAINNVYRWIEATYPQYLRIGRVRATIPLVQGAVT